MRHRGVAEAQREEITTGAKDAGMEIVIWMVIWMVGYMDLGMCQF